MSVIHDKELEQFRDLVKPAERFDEGFGWKTMLGALFVGIVMLPAAMYMSLMIGESFGPAAKYVTVILFLEMTKRARTGLKTAEIFILFAMVGALVSNPMGNFFWKQFLVQSEAARSYGLTELFPTWFAPTDASVLDQQSFLMWEWAVPLCLMFVGMVVGRLESLVLGYGLFRIASDIEKLPFPLAPIGASGVLALSENASGKEGWRWRCFSIGTVFGMAFAVLYVFLPAFSHMFHVQSTYQIFPIPWLDTSTSTEGFLPATPTGISFDLHQFFMGMALPFFGVLGAFIAVLIILVANPILHHVGILHSWKEGMQTPEILFQNNLDFYLSFGIGLSAAVALIGFWQCFKSVRDRRQPHLDRPLSAVRAPPPRSGRGDIATWLVLAVYVAASAFYILLCGWLLDWNFQNSWLLWILIGFAFIYTPIISYVTARLEGLVGQALHIPYIKEAAFIFSGYKGIEIWLLPIPMQNFGDNEVVQYRTAELIGCSFRSIWKLAAFSLPLLFILSLLYAEFIWSLGPVPGPAYPYASTMWDMNAKNQCVVLSSTLGGYNPFLESIHLSYILAGGAIGLVTYMLLAGFGLPVLLLYGVVKGLGGSIPQHLVVEMAGAVFGRYVMAPRFGPDRWRQYAPVVLAGYLCGAGLVQMFSVGGRFLSASVFQLPY